MLVLLIYYPMFNLPEDILPGSLQAPLPVPRTVSSICGMAHTVEKGEVCCFLFIVHRT